MIAILFSVLICLKNGKFATFVIWSFQFTHPYFQNSESDVSENNHVLLESIVLMYSKIFLNSKIRFSRKCQNKSVCVRRFLRCIDRESYISSHVLLKLLNKMGKRDKMLGLLSILSLFRDSFNTFNNIRARMLDSIYHMTLRLLWNLISAVKTF